MTNEKTEIAYNNCDTIRIRRTTKNIGKANKTYSGYSVEAHLIKENEWVMLIFESLSDKGFVHKSLLECIQLFYDNGIPIIWETDSGQ